MSNTKKISHKKIVKNQKLSNDKNVKRQKRLITERSMNKYVEYKKITSKNVYS